MVGRVVVGRFVISCPLVGRFVVGCPVAGRIVVGRPVVGRLVVGRPVIGDLVRLIVGELVNATMGLILIVLSSVFTLGKDVLI